MSGTREGEGEYTCAHVLLCVLRAMDVALCAPPWRAGTSGHSSRKHGDIRVCRACVWSWHTRAQAHMWLCTCLCLCSHLQSVAGEHPWALCGQVSLCVGRVSTTAAGLRLPLTAPVALSAQRKRAMSCDTTPSCSWASSFRTNTATPLRVATVVQNTSPPSPYPVGPHSTFQGRTDALRPALEHRACCKTRAEPRQPHMGSLRALIPI